MKRALLHAVLGMGAFAAATAFASPANAAATSDLDLTLTGTTISVSADKKSGTFTINNNGPDAVSDISLVVDISGLDDTKVTFTADTGDCTPAADVYDCLVPGPIDSGESWDYPFLLTKVGAATGDGGHITVTIDAEGDDNTANNSKTVDVVLSESSAVDLAAYAWDIFHVADPTDGPEGATTPVLPGANSFFYGDVVNWGGTNSSTIEMKITLPTGVTFVGSEPDCDYITGSTSTSCKYAGDSGVVLAGGKDYNRYYFEVTVAADVAGPVVLGGGEFTVENVEEVPSISARGTASTKTVTRGAVSDVDLSDNTDKFSAYVGKKAGHPGDLPVTGDQVRLVAGVGTGAVVLGALLFVGARRRRHSVTTP